MESSLKAFILTSHWNENSDYKLEYYVTTDEGPALLRFNTEKFVIFIAKTDERIKTSVQYEKKTVPLKSFDHKPVDAIYLKTSSDYFNIKNDLKDAGIRTFESDIWPQDRFLMERFINGGCEVFGQFEVVNGIRIYSNPQIRKANYNPKFTVLSVDIETGVKGELYSIGVEYSGIRMFDYVYMLSDKDEKINDELSYYRSEENLIKAFLKDFYEYDPDLIIGWHVIGFDLSFLVDKCMKLKIPFPLGRDKGEIKIEEKKGMGFFAHLKGRVVIDGPPALRSAFYSFKNFKLETVASEVLGTSKDIASDSGKVTEIERRFKEDKVALAKYNLLDSKLVTDIFKELKIINFLIERVRISGLLIDRLGISAAALDHALLPLLHRKGYVAPNALDLDREEQSTGGMVIEPKTGLHKDVAVFDFKSLYPSIIRTFKIDPYALIKSDIDPVRTPVGNKFSKTENLLPNIIEDLLEKRAFAKEQKNNALNMAIKILMNSFYGLMGSYRCRFYHADLPTNITQSGHWILKQSIEFFENLNLEVLYGDTDSLFLKLPDNEKDKEKFALNLKDKLNDFLKRLILDEFGVPSFLELEYEKKYDQIYFSSMRDSTSGAKKKYAGYINGKIHFVGMEYIRSDWTDLAKNFQHELYSQFFMGEPVESFIKKYILDLKNGLYDDQLVYTKRLTKDPKEYTKNIPQHVRAALLVDHKGPYRLKEVSYILTMNGPIPIQNNPLNPDYEHYIEKQIRPIADQILKALGTSFDGIQLGDQLSLF